MRAIQIFICDKINNNVANNVNNDKKDKIFIRAT